MKKMPSDIQELILKNIKVNFSDIVGMSDVKNILEQAIIRPRKRPDLY
jgi:SpoVK/Ycf46/Vps4 family AAA+-type ATPase